MSSKDFDFYVGIWDVENERLSKPLVGATDWYTFPGRSVARTLWGGAGNFDEITFPTLGWAGATLRLFRPDSGTWALHWANSRTGLLDDNPVIGGFTDGVGEFFADEDYEDTPIRVRYRWSDISATTARWEQAFSTDKGETWETNWIMRSTRVE